MSRDQLKDAIVEAAKLHRDAISACKAVIAESDPYKTDFNVFRRVETTEKNLCQAVDALLAYDNERSHVD
jgi:hypothetical protein